jgi:putative serine protease PepD
MKIAVLLLSLFVASCASLNTEMKKSERLKESNSVVIVLVHTQTKDILTGLVEPIGWSGTGFSVSEDGDGSTIITNKHVCNMKDDATYELTLADGSKHSATFVKVAPGADLCVLHTGQGIDPVVLAKQDAKKGDEVSVIGAPHGMYPMFTSGIVSGYYWIDMSESEYGSFEVHVYAQMFSAPIYPGSSGSPVFDTSGKVVGIVFAGRSDADHMSWLIPVSEINRFLDTSQNVYTR